MKTNIVFSDYYKPYFTNESMKIPLNFLLGKNVHLSKMAAEKKKGERARASGHVTGNFTGGSREGLQRA